MSILGTVQVLSGSTAVQERHSTIHPSLDVHASPQNVTTKSTEGPSKRSVACKTLTFHGDTYLANSAPENFIKAAAPSTLRGLKPASDRQGMGHSSQEPALLDSSLALKQQLDTLQQNLSSKTEWRERIRGLTLLREMTSELAALPGDVLLRICDDLALAVVHNNLKVQLEALQTLEAVLARAAGGEGLAPCLSSLVPALARALDSGALAARNLAISSLDAMVTTADATLFIQPYMQAVVHSTNVRSKAALLERLQGLVRGLYAAKAHLVLRYVLPPLFTGLGDKSLHATRCLAFFLSTVKLFCFFLGDVFAMFTSLCPG